MADNDFGWYGIKDECCIEKNIKYVYVNDGLGQCQICKRIFKRKQYPTAK